MPKTGYPNLKYRSSIPVAGSIEALRNNLRRIFDPQGIVMFPIRSLTPQQATGNALAAGFIGYEWKGAATKKPA